MHDDDLDIPAYERYEAAIGLLDMGFLDNATTEFIWLWKNCGRGMDGMGGVRTSFMAGHIEQLVIAHPPAREAFEELRAQTESRMRHPRLAEELIVDWVTLNEILGEPQRTIEWFDEVNADPGARRLIELVDVRLERLLIEGGRWSDIGIIYPNPLRTFNEDLRWQSMEIELGDSKRQEEFRDVNARIVRERAAVLYAAMLSCGRDEVASSIAIRAREHEGSGKMIVALVRTALLADEPRAVHLDWLREASKQGEASDGLFQQVEAALRARS